MFNKIQSAAIQGKDMCQIPVEYLQPIWRKIREIRSGQLEIHTDRQVDRDKLIVPFDKAGTGLKITV
jgi:hypothetical protein